MTSKLIGSIAGIPLRKDSRGALTIDWRPDVFRFDVGLRVTPSDNPIARVAAEMFRAKCRAEELEARRFVGAELFDWAEQNVPEEMP